MPAKTLTQRVERQFLLFENPAKSNLKLIVTGQDIDQILVQETVAGHGFKQQMQEEAELVHGHVCFLGHRQKIQHLCLIGPEQFLNDIAFAFEVVIQVARADLQLIRDQQSGDVGLPKAVEQQQAGVEDPIPGFDFLHP